MQVMGDRFRQVDGGACGERLGAVETGHADPVRVKPGEPAKTGILNRLHLGLVK
jgi:hypothetical protein